MLTIASYYVSCSRVAGVHDYGYAPGDRSTDLPSLPHGALSCEMSMSGEFRCRLWTSKKNGRASIVHNFPCSLEA